MIKFTVRIEAGEVRDLTRDEALELSDAIQNRLSRENALQIAIFRSNHPSCRIIIGKTGEVYSGWYDEEGGHFTGVFVAKCPSHGVSSTGFVRDPLLGEVPLGEHLERIRAR